MTDDLARIAILIVAFRNPADVRSCLTALSAAAPNPSFDVFVCENGGEAAFRDLSATLVGPLGPCQEGVGHASPGPIPLCDRLVEVQRLNLHQRHSSVWIFQAAYNLGYAGAINALIDQLRYLANWEGVWILNPDTTPTPRALAELVAYAKTADKGMVGSTIVPKAAGDRIHCRGGLHWSAWTSRAIALGLNERLDAPVDIAKIEAKIDSPSGASMFVTRACLNKIGPMDERFFLYYEDIDWGIRAKSLGLGYAAASIVVHEGGTTIGSSSTRRRERSWLSIYLESRNRVLFVRKHYPWRILFAHIFFFLYALKYVFAGSYEDFRTALEGWLAGISGEVGPPSRLAPEFLAPRQPKIPSRAWRRTKLVISVIYYLGIATTDLLRGLAGNPARRRLTILYYHGVRADFLFEFRRQMEALSRTVHVIPADFRGEVMPGRRSVAITFDDAFASVWENALPALYARSFHCTIFVPVDLIGRAPSWSVEDPSLVFGESVMTRSQLNAVSPTLVTIGSHGLTHQHLFGLPSDLLKNEIEESCFRLEEFFGQPVRLIAVPYGDLDLRVIEACKKAGYEFVYTTVPENIDSAATGILRGRVPVDPWDGPAEFFLKSNGAYAWLRSVKSIVSLVGFRAP